MTLLGMYFMYSLQIVSYFHSFSRRLSFSLISYTYCLEMQSSLAEEIPEELFEGILWYACGCGVYGELDKLCVSAFGQVNRYWALLCRRELFGAIRLRCVDDAHRFRDILTTPAFPGLEPVSDLVRRLCCTPLSEDIPWLHFIFLSILPLIKDPDLEIQVWPIANQLWRAFPPSLPRSLPGSVMPISELRLDGVQFASRRKLSQLLSSIPLLISLYAFNITYVAKPRTNDFFTPFATRFNYIASDDLQLCLSMLTSLFISPYEAEWVPGTAGNRRSCSPKHVIHEDDLATLREMFDVFRTAQAFEVFRILPESRSTYCLDSECPSICKVSACGTMIFSQDFTLAFRALALQAS